MSLHLNISGAWRECNEVYVNINGTWQRVIQIYVNISGSWRPIWTFEWVLGQWSTCTAECGGGTQTRTVTCQQEGITYADALCTALVGAKPPTSQTCNSHSCANYCRFWPLMADMDSGCPNYYGQNDGAACAGQGGGWIGFAPGQTPGLDAIQYYYLQVDLFYAQRFDVTGDWSGPISFEGCERSRGPLECTKYPSGALGIPGGTAYGFAICWNI